MKVSELKELFDVEGVAELKPGAQYLVKIPDEHLTPKVVQNACDALKHAGFDSVMVMPASWKIYKIEEA